MCYIAIIVNMSSKELKNGVKIVTNTGNPLKTMTSILSYQKAYNLSKQYYPDFYPNEFFYLESKFFIPKSEWSYPTVEGITPSSDFRIQKVQLFYNYYKRDIDRLKGIIKNPTKLTEHLKDDPAFYHRTSRTIAAYEKIEPLASRSHWKKAAKILFFLEKEEASTLKDTMPEFHYLNNYYDDHYLNDIVILKLPKDLESSWKEAAKRAYTLAMHSEKVKAEVKELLTKKTNWLIK